MADLKIEIYAIKIGQRKVPTSLVLYQPEHHGETMIHYYFWCVRYGEKILLVDTGFRPETAKEKGLINIRHPVDQLLKLGITSDQIEIVICSHLHWDHIDGAEFFRRATFFIPEQDLIFFTGPAITHNEIRQYICQQDLQNLVGMASEGRTELLNGDRMIFPGIKVHFVGGHTPGLHFVSIESDTGKVVLSSDLCYLYKNLREEKIPGLFVNLMEMLHGFQKLKKCASKGNLIIPSHDPELANRFPTIENGEIIKIL